MRKTILAMLATGVLMTPLFAQSPSPIPGFWELEKSYERDPSLALSRNVVSAAIPAGTPLHDAEARLIDVGAGCKVKRKQPAVTRCLIHQYSLADGAADDIRWTVSLQSSDGRVAGLGVDRYVDRHGTN